MRVLIFAVVMATLTACATASKTYTYRPAGHGDKPAWAISAKSETGTVNDKVLILVNGEPVITGTIGMLKTEDSWTAEHQGHRILAECWIPDISGFVTTHRCTIFVDNERAADLRF